MKIQAKVLGGLVAVVALAVVAQSASAQLVGFYVYRDAYNRGLVINNFIPGSSADNLHRQGQLFAGDIIFRYNGQPVFSADQVRQISAQMGPGMAKMEFLTPNGQYFYHWVSPFGGGVAACEPGQAAQPCYRFEMGQDRNGGQPAVNPQDGGGRPQDGPFDGGPGRPQGPGRPW